MKDRNFHLFLLLSLIGILSWSVIHPKDLFTWFLEVFPAIIGGTILIFIYPKFRFTNLVYFLIWIHAIILIVGGHYTYAEMPLFNWLKDIFHLSRNYYDRLGHFAQGFIPAMIIREILLRNRVLKKGKWLFCIVVSMCLAISAAYELLEFTVALLTGTAAEAFLGTQGDIWDTQWDMLFALWGAITALLVLGKYHDYSLRSSHKS
jgi:putative membrane protein